MQKNPLLSSNTAPRIFTDTEMGDSAVNKYDSIRQKLRFGWPNNHEQV